MAYDSLAAALDTLAATHAKAGQFDKAVLAATQAINAANTAGNQKLAREIRQRLYSYRNAAKKSAPIKESAHNRDS